MEEVEVLDTLTFEVVKLQNGDIRIYDCQRNILSSAMFISSETINSRKVVLQ